MGELGRRRIVIVDDELDLRQTLAELFIQHGYDVSVAANGAEALRLLGRARVPNVILLDLMMPVMDGWQLTTELAKYPAFRKIPVLLVSAVHDLNDHARQLRAAAALNKPFAVSSVLELVARHCA
jgi:CheY-like chemotaxis protein